LSHYTRVTTKITRRSALVKALQQMGFKKHMIEVSDTAMNLKGYQGDTREGKIAHVRIKGHGWGSSQNYVGGLSNDLGFERMEDGSYAFHVSDYDVGSYNDNWQKKLLKEYGRAVVGEISEEQGFFVESEEEEENGIRIRLTTPF